MEDMGVEAAPKRGLMKNKYLWIILVAIVVLLGAIIGAWLIIDAKETQRLDAESVTLKDDLQVEFGTKVRLSDFLAQLNGVLVENTEVNTENLGTQEVSFDYINSRNKRRTYKFSIEVVDTTKPKIYGSSSYTVPLNYQGDLTDLMLSGDNLDDAPQREITGDYNLEKTGNYPLEYVVTDASGNVTKQKFTLKVVKPTTDDGTPVSLPKQPIKDVIRDYKTNLNQIGIDVSQWQGEIDWQKVQKAGVEFAMIRVGYQKGYEGEYVLDPYFEQNVQGATEVGLPVGVYFYSYATNTNEARQQAEWVREQIADYELELGVAFDWEDWGNFNSAGMSFRTINQVANTFLDTFAGAGYKGWLYGSKVYLERIWQPETYPVWLAQYYHEATYKGEYKMWQLSNTGRVDGIDGDVDLDILYLD